MSKLLMIKTLLAICVVSLCTSLAIQSFTEKSYEWMAVFGILAGIQFFIIRHDIKQEIND
jgi:hypothetical protein